MEDHILSIPLLATTAVASSPASALTTTATSAANTKEDDKIGFFSSSFGIIPRILLVIFIGTISIWANHEASKGFKVSLINNAKDSPAGKRFALFYVSNDEGTRIIQNTSALVENILYPDDGSTNQNQAKKKPVKHVVLQLSTKNLTKIVETSKSKNFVYTISLSPSVLEDHESSNNVGYAVKSAIQRGMARIWLWDGESMAPPRLIDGMEEYIWSKAGFGDNNNNKEIITSTTAAILQYPGILEQPEHELCLVLSQVCSNGNYNFSSGNELGRVWWEDKDPKCVAQSLGYLEQQKKGYIRRLNQILRDRWDDPTVPYVWSAD